MMQGFCRLYVATIARLCSAQIRWGDVTGRFPRGKASPGKRRDAHERMDAALRGWSAQASQLYEPIVSTISGDSFADRAPQDRQNPCGHGTEEDPGPDRAESLPASACYEPDIPASKEAGFPSEVPEEPLEMPKPQQPTDYYELLQISRNADMETLHRVYRIMAARFHPDNPRTGDADRFLLLTRAHQVLSDPAQRVQYDAALLSRDVEPLPVFQLREFVDGIDGEINRRLGVLSLLYHRRRMNPSQPGISVLDLERRMAFPREYLNFTLWYLRAKGYVRSEENSDCGITVEGVDYVEATSSTNTIIRDLLTEGSDAGAKAAEIRIEARSCDPPELHSESCAA
jgi:hypothetical protein